MPASRTRAKNKEAQPKISSLGKHTKSRAKKEPSRKAHPVSRVLLNPLPTPQPKSRPAADVYVWGKPGFGQLGLGSTVLDDILKPRKHPGVAAQVALGTFGTEPGAGIVSVASGGMHTFLLDENGMVCDLVSLFILRRCSWCRNILDMVSWCQ